MNALGGPPLTMAAVVVLGALATFSLGVEPAVAARLGAQLALPPHAVAHILAAELGASMLATPVALIWSRRFPPRAVTGAACALFIGSNLVSLAWPAYGALLAARAAAGLAGGTLLIVVLSAAARCRDAGRAYAAWVVGQGLAATAGLCALPALFARFGLAGLYGLLAVASALALPLVRGLMPAAEVRVAAQPGQVPSAGAAATAALLVLFLFYTAVGGIWAFAAERGKEAGLDPALVADALALATIVGTSGAVLAAIVARRGRAGRGLTAGHVLLGCALVCFAAAAGSVGFAGSVAMLRFAWSFAAPLLLARVAGCGASASMMSAANVVLGSALTLGPLLTGTLLERPGRFALAVSAALALLATGVLVLIGGPQPPRADSSARVPQGDAAS